ncbi:MAG TPA: nitroreductase family protein [Phycisphaerae bacterium]|nr:nitroreductase family protein [Phycisphaerae bacterium]
MDLYEAIRERRSVRAYQERPVEDEKLRRVLEAGRLSPSARNRQERKFVVVRDARRRAAVAEAAGQPWLAQAPVILAVVGTTPEAVMHCGVPTDPVDCAIAMDHMTLAAVAEGLGTCWIGHFDQDACRRALGVPDGAKIIELLPMGYPAEQPPARPRKPIEEIVCPEAFR